MGVGKSQAGIGEANTRLQRGTFLLHFRTYAVWEEAYIGAA
jgi:hypothetical protein